MTQVGLGALYSVVLFVVMLWLLHVGHRAGLRAREQDAGAAAGTNAVDGAVFALLGLMIAFTFSGAASRFDGRRTYITHETNAIGTAWLRIDVAPPAEQPALRALLRDYLDARFSAYQRVPDLRAAFAELERANALQAEIWAAANRAVRSPEAAPGASVLLLPALNEMFDIATTRTLAIREHPPVAIYGLLFLLASAGAFFAGFGIVGRVYPRLHAVGFAAIVSATVYLTIDLEYPRQGLIRVDDFDQALMDLRRTMDES